MVPGNPADIALRLSPVALRPVVSERFALEFSDCSLSFDVCIWFLLNKIQFLWIF
jgi:hypothetical protein